MKTMAPTKTGEPRPLPERTIELLKAKGFKIVEDGARATYRGAIVIEIIRAGSDLELCFTFKDGGTLYAKPSGVLLAEADREV